MQANPLFEAKAFAYKGEVTVAQLPKMRAMTIEGLCIFLDIHKSTWIDYRNRERFRDVTDRVDAIIRTQKFEGAAAKLLNGKIITRDLGLVEKKQLDATIDAQRGSLKSKPLDEQVHAIGFHFYKLIVQAELSDNAKAHEKALGWMDQCVKALKGETYFGARLKDVYGTRSLEGVAGPALAASPSSVSPLQALRASRKKQEGDEG